MKDSFKLRNASLIALYNDKWEVFFQNRTSMSKRWEMWWFFGGWLDGWENHEEALIREVKEELNIDLKPGDYKYICSLNRSIEWIWENNSSLYIAFFKDDFKKDLQILEWDAWEFFSIDELRKLKVIKWDHIFFDMLEIYFEKNNIIK